MLKLLFNAHVEEDKSVSHPFSEWHTSFCYPSIFNKNANGDRRLPGWQLQMALVSERKVPECPGLCGGDRNSSRNGHSERGARINSSSVCLFGGWCLCFAVIQELKSDMLYDYAYGTTCIEFMWLIISNLLNFCIL